MPTGPAYHGATTRSGFEEWVVADRERIREAEHHARDSK
jgi:hypothetical protein